MALATAGVGGRAAIPQEQTEAMRTNSGVERIPPRLTKLDDGNVIVLGGVQQDPNAPREKLSEGQVLKTATAPSPSTAAPTNATPNTKHPQLCRLDQGTVVLSQEPLSGSERLASLFERSARELDA